MSGEKSNGEEKNFGRAKIGKSHLTRLHQKHAHTMTMTIESLKSLSLCSADPVRSAGIFDPPPASPCESDPPHGIKLATKRGAQTRKWFRGGGGGKTMLPSK